MADSLPFEDDEALADSQEHLGRVVVVHTRRYLVEKVWDLLIGVFSSMFLCGQHNSVPMLSDSRMFRGSVILRAISTKGRAMLCFVLGQPILNLWSFLTGYLSTQFSALQVSSKNKRVRQKKKKNPSTSRKGGEGFAKQEEGSPVIKRPSDQGKDSDGGASVQSAFRRLIVNDVLSSFIPRPGPLGMNFCSKNPAKSCIKESQVAFKSSYKRNAIASSYSSTLAQWPPERVPTRATGRATPGTASGATAGAATQPTRGAAPGSASRAAAGATRGAALDAAAGATYGAVSGAASGDAPDAAAGASRGATPDAAAGATRGAVPGAVSGTAAGAAAQPTGGAAPGAAPDADVRTTRAASGAAANAASGDAIDADADLDAVSDAPPCTLPFPSQDSSQSTEATKKGDEKGGAPSGISKKKEKREKRKKEKKERKKAKQAAAAAAAAATAAAEATQDKQGKQGKQDKQGKQGKQSNPKKGLSTSDIPKPVRRKIPLFPPHRRDIPLVLPPPPELCFRITVEDFDLEKKIAMQWINKVLKGKCKAAWSATPHSFPGFCCALLRGSPSITPSEQREHQEDTES